MCTQDEPFLKKTDILIVKMKNFSLLSLTLRARKSPDFSMIQLWEISLVRDIENDLKECKSREIPYELLQTDRKTAHFYITEDCK